MDAKQDQHPPMQGDDELAKALQGGLQFEETPVPEGQMPPSAAQDAQTQTEEAPTLGTALPQPDDAQDESAGLPPEIQHSHAKNSAEPKQPPANDLPAVSTGNDSLDKLKASALKELRPLVGKLKLAPEDRFDTLLLIIRSTDDQSLLDEAHAAAKEITDDTKRAEALLDVIKEIDYFSSKR